MPLSSLFSAYLREAEGLREEVENASEAQDKQIIEEALEKSE